MIRKYGKRHIGVPLVSRLKVTVRAGQMPVEAVDHRFGGKT